MTRPAGTRESSSDWSHGKQWSVADLIVAIGLIVRTVFLTLSLPKEDLEHHYHLTWTGFDLVEVLAIYLTCHLAFRDRASATGAPILARCAELAAAAFSLYVACRVGRVHAN